MIYKYVYTVEFTLDFSIHVENNLCDSLESEVNKASAIYDKDKKLLSLYTEHALFGKNLEKVRAIIYKSENGVKIYQGELQEVCA